MQLSNFPFTMEAFLALNQIHPDSVTPDTASVKVAVPHQTEQYASTHPVTSPIVLAVAPREGMHPWLVVG